MPTQQLIRLRIIRIIQEQRSMTRSSLVRRFNTSDRPRSDSEIGRLLSDGFLIVTGTGRRGDPLTVHIGPAFPKNKCPMCLQECS
jgi:predicted HTH transcriptional regulator